MGSIDYSDVFFARLNWAVERKDFEDFWPVGLESTGPRYWPQLALDLENTFNKEKRLIEPDFPTSNMAMAFCLIYGVRELGWKTDRTKKLFNAVFDAAKTIKAGDLFNADGKNCIWTQEELLNRFANAVKIKNELTRDMYELSGQLLAMAESEYFMNHRICTEKHGPYYLNDGSFLVVRSVRNLKPIHLWPVLETIDIKEKEFDIFYRYSYGDVRFDMLSNLLTTLPPEDSLISIHINDYDNTIWDKDYVHYFSSSVCNIIVSILECIANMTRIEKSEQMTRILYYGSRKCFDSWLDMANNAITIGRKRAIKIEVPKDSTKRLRYYNLLSDYTE